MLPPALSRLAASTAHPPAALAASADYFDFAGLSSGLTKLAPARSGAAHLDHDRLPHLDEVGDVGGLGVEAPGRQRLQGRRIELLAVGRVPGAGQDRHLA